MSTQSLTSRGFLSFLATQFLGAMNDNIFKFLLIGYATHVLSPAAQRSFVPLAAAVFILPYFLFSGIAGSLADRYAKRSVMIWTKWLELAVMLCGTFFAWRQQPYALLGVLFVMGTQSTLFSPAKYGYLPEILEAGRLSMGNGLLQLFTFLPIIIGGGLGGYLSGKYAGCLWLGTLYCVFTAAVGILASYGIAVSRPGDSTVRLAVDPVTPHVRTLGVLLRNPRLRFAILGNTYFWLVAALVQSNIPILVKEFPRLPDVYMGYFQAMLALGIGLGSALAGKFSRSRIAYHFVLPGGICLAVALVLCGLASRVALSLLLCMVTGIAGGFYQLPLATCLQQESPVKMRGAALAAVNVLDSIAMLLAAALHWVFLNPCQLSGAAVLVALGGMTAFFLLLLRCVQPHGHRDNA